MFMFFGISLESQINYNRAAVHSVLCFFKVNDVVYILDVEGNKYKIEGCIA